MTIGRIAVVHDYLSQSGGAERVALMLAEMFNAPIYTSVYQPELTFAEFARHEVHTSYLQRVIPRGKFRFAAPLLGSAFDAMDLSAFDKVIVSSSGFAHHVRHPNAYVYCHTPPRFIYDIDEYASSGLVRAFAVAIAPVLRRADQQAAERHANYAANSQRTAERVANVYGKSAPVIHPPIRVDHLPAVPVPAPTTASALVVARLQPYKRIDVAIEACAKLSIPLTVVGTGIDESRLRSLAGSGVTFLGRVSDAELSELFERHSVVLAPGIDDFGFAPVEANYAGRPVVARRAGGALETVRDGETGALVDSDDALVWADAITEVLDRSWDPFTLRDFTGPFQRPDFETKLRRWIAD